MDDSEWSDHCCTSKKGLAITVGLSGSPLTGLDGRITGILEATETDLGNGFNNPGKLDVSIGYLESDAESLPEWTRIVKGEYPDAKFYAYVRPASAIISFLEQYCNEKQHDSPTGIALNQPSDAVLRFPRNPRDRKFYSKHGYAPTNL